MTIPTVPVDAKSLDWPRKVANAINALGKLLQDGLAGLTTTEAQGSGWGNYQDTAGAQMLTATTRTLWTNNAGTTDETQKPSDLPTFWSGNKIWAKVGDAIAVRVHCVFTPSSALASTLLIELDIGTGSPIESTTVAVTGGSGVDQAVSFTFIVFARTTFATNGAQIYVTADGPGAVTLKRILIARIHRGR